MKKYYRVIYSDELYHHGIKGQKWGIQNGPPYPLDEQRKTKIEKVKDSSIHGRLKKKLKDTLNVSDEQAEKYIKVAKVLGISLATTAGVYLVVSNSDAISSAVEHVYNNKNVSINNDAFNKNKDSGENYYHRVIGYNQNNIGRTSSIDELHSLSTDQLGFRAEMNGYVLPKDGSDLFNNVAMHHADDDVLCYETVVAQRNRLSLQTDRRLSCWSGSHSYLLSKLTGNQYASRNYQNLVEFNDFKTLYKNKQKIYDIFGNEKNDFIGKFGVVGEKINGDSDGKKLISTIYKMFSTPNCPDGSSVGFINAAYRKSTCSHQWNFQIDKNGILSMVDCWSGQKYKVASYGNESIKTDNSGFELMMNELYHYNRDSFRIYSPKLEDLDLDRISKIVCVKRKRY